MIVYGPNRPKKEQMNLYHGIHRKAAADVPPLTDKKESKHEESKDLNSSEHRFFDDLIDDFFDGKIDNDKLLIGAFMYLLIKEGADMKLIIALGYILM